MNLEGSCHCKKVQFAVFCEQPTPIFKCYCSICRKLGCGFNINLGGDSKTLEIKTGKEFIKVYRAKKGEGLSSNERNFCSECGAHLWCYDANWPDLIHPYASCIDTELPHEGEYAHIMVGSKASWVPLEVKEGEEVFQEYPNLCLKDWHEKHTKKPL